MIPCNPYGEFTLQTFDEVFTSMANFKSGFNASAFTGIITDTSLGLVYSLLSAKYGNSKIANKDVNQFKNKLYATIWQYAPTWERNLSIQASLRNLTDNELITGTKQINDHSYNPSTELESGPNPSTGELTSVNEQTKSKFVKSKMDGYAMLISLLEKDVTEEFMGRFKRLFIMVAIPVIEEDDEEEGDEE